MFPVQALCAKSPRAAAKKLWWRGQVLACVDASALESGNSPACPAAMADQTATALQHLAALGVSGVWIGEPDMSDPLVRVQTQGARVLVAAPVAPGQTSAPCNAHDMLRLVQSQTWFAAEPIAPTVHAVLSRLYKTRTNQWPCWLLAAQGNDESPMQMLRHQLLVAIQLSLKGTCLLPKAITQDARCLAPHCARFLAWRNELVPLVAGKIRLLPMHGNLLMYVRESHGQQVLCVFNPSDRYVRVRLPEELASAHLLPGSGLSGARLVNQHIDCDPWSALFAVVVG